MSGNELNRSAPLDVLVTIEVRELGTDEQVYEFPKEFKKRRRRNLVILPVLFYGALLAGLLLSGSWDRGLVVSLMAFLSLVLLLFMALAWSARPWIIVYTDSIMVGGHRFRRDDLRTVVVYVDRRMMFERPPYQLIFVVDDPHAGPTRYTSEAVRNVQDVDTLVRDLRHILPGVEFVDRTPTGASAVSEQTLAAMGDGPGQG